jgi:two-component system cell cycle sensor histidine kinase/response regulator CckA
VIKPVKFNAFTEAMSQVGFYSLLVNQAKTRRKSAEDPMKQEHTMPDKDFSQGKVRKVAGPLADWPCWAILALLMIIRLGLSVYPVAAQATPQVIILNSYHQGFAWSNAEEAGFLERLREVYPTLDVPIEYLDAKRYPNQENLARMKDFLLGKYQGQRIDLVVVFDNSALDMLMRYRNELFPDSPVVFAGVSNFEPSMLTGRTGITGVAEKQNVRDTLETALTFHPQTKEVVVLDDYTTSGLASRREVEALVPLFKGRVQIHFLPPSTFDEARDQIGSLSPDALVLIHSFSTDRLGRSLSLAESTRILTSEAQVPVYAGHETRLGHGIVGGYLLGGRDHGRRAADIALKILAGEDPSTIRVDTKSTAQPMFDYVQLERFGVSVRDLPAGSIIVNRPESIFDQYPELVIGTLIVVTILVVMVIFLIVSIIQRRQVEKALKESEERLRLALEGTADGIWDWNPRTGQAYFSPRYYTMLGYEPGEFPPTYESWQQLLHPDDVKAVEKAIQHALKEHIPYAIEFRFKAKSGEWRWILSRGKIAELDRSGEAVRVAGSHTDITERKQAEEALRLTQQAVDRARDAIHWVGADGKLLYVNEATCQSLGYTREELLSMTVFDIDPLFSKEMWPEHWQKERGRGNYILETIHKAKDGRIFPVEIAVDRVNYGGQEYNCAYARDITERKRTEEILRESEERYRQLFELESDAIFLIDNEAGRILEANSAASDLYGYSREELLTKKNTDLSAEPEDTQQVTQTTTTIPDRVVTVPLRFHRKKDGTVFPVEITGRFFIRQGRPVHIAAIRDITERKQAEEALQMFRYSIDQASVAVFWMNREAGFSYVNDQACHSLGYTREELLRLRLWDIDPFYPKERWASNWEQYQENRQGGEESLETCHRRKDGVVFPVEVSSKHLWFGDTELHVAFVRDITERKEAEEQLLYQANLLQNVSDAIVATDLNFDITSWNQAAEALYGWPAREVIGQPVHEILQTEHPYARSEQIQGRLLERGIWRGEVIQKHRNGAAINILASVSLVKDSTGNPVGAVAALRDITERKQAEQAQAKLEEQLRQAQKMESIGRLAGGVAHDFNNLLTVIQGYCGLIQAQIPSESPLLEDLKQIQRAAERATALTRHLLAFSRKQILAPTTLDLNSLVTNLRKMLERLIGEDITLSTVLQPDLWTIIADPGQIEQVIMNLAVNARDAMPTGGMLTIETSNVQLDENYLRTQLEAPSGPCVMLVITDTGCGMDEATRAQIFEPFFTTKELDKGTGLGLATAYGIIKQSGGDITVYSEPGRGATFRIYLPASEITSSSLAISQVNPVTRGGNETILLVEDEETVRKLARTALQGKGYTILEAGRGGEALSLFEQHQGLIDLLVTDVVMPQMSGRELAEQLKALQPQLKVLFMSGYTDDAIVRHGLLAAEVEYLSKPFSLNVLASKVRELLDK